MPVDRTVALSGESVENLCMSAKADVIAAVCQALDRGEASDAAEILKQYPFAGQAAVARRYSLATCMRVFMRDGFIDRYSGERLVFPGALRILSQLLPEEFPYHPNWKMASTHPAFWELFPTIDHVVPVTVPVTKGGTDEEVNLVTTSMLRNAAKCHWTLEELGWQLLPEAGPHWDGLTAWCIAFVRAKPAVLTSDPYLRRWHAAAIRVAKVVENGPAPRLDRGAIPGTPL
jgi:hypothetical protein